MKKGYWALIKKVKILTATTTSAAAATAYIAIISFAFAMNFDLIKQRTIARKVAEVAKMIKKPSSKKSKKLMKGVSKLVLRDKKDTR